MAEAPAATSLVFQTSGLTSTVPTTGTLDNPLHDSSSQGQLAGFSEAACLFIPRSPPFCKYSNGLLQCSELSRLFSKGIWVGKSSRLITFPPVPPRKEKGAGVAHLPSVPSCLVCNIKQENCTKCRGILSYLD